MKISIEWLRDYVDLPGDIAQLRQDLTMAGLVVESVEQANGAPVLEIEVTANRPDCLSYLGVAREIAALYRGHLRAIPLAKALRRDGERIPYSIEIHDPDLCPRYVGLLLDGIRVGPSPDWLQKRLQASGMRPVNNVVDITNYVLLEVGHPLHAFDFDRLRQGRIVVARARQDQRMVTLDGVERVLDGEMLLINDGGGPVAIAGIMGGRDSEINGATDKVLLECAYFTPASIRRTSRKLGLSTEASYRFERGADWNGPTTAIARACYLIRRMARGRIAGNCRDVYPSPIAPVEIELSGQRTESLLGVRLAPEFIESTLKRLYFKPVRKGKGRWLVQCPSHRADMELEADLIEEIARFHGYQHIPPTLPPGRVAGKLSASFAYESAVRNILIGLGYHETVNLSFAGDADIRRFPLREGGAPLEIRNPLTEDTQYLRGSLAPGLLRNARHNFNHDVRQLRIFEIGKVFCRDTEGAIVERNALGILGTGGFAGKNWLHTAGEYEFFHLKGVVTTLLSGLRCAGAEVTPASQIPWLNDSRRSALLVDGKCLGVLGALHPSLEEELKLKQPVFLAEIDLQSLCGHLFAPARYRPLPRFPAVERDLSVLVPMEISYGTLREGILARGIPELASIDLMDVYEGEQIPAGKAGITVRLTFLDREGTLTVDRVQSFSDNIRAFLQEEYGAAFR